MLEWTDWHQKHTGKIELIAGVDCWIWTGAQGGHGYGRVSYHKKAEFAHRASYMEAFGPIPNGMLVRHMCAVRFCVRPGHLKLGTHADNSRDAAEIFSLRGNLVESDIIAIRDEYRSGISLSEIADRHGIAYGSVYPIVIGKSYRFVAGEDAGARRSPRKLTAVQVKSIRQELLIPDANQTQIAKKYGVNQPLISRIKTGKSHKASRHEARQGPDQSTHPR